MDVVWVVKWVGKIDKVHFLIIKYIFFINCDINALSR